MKLKRGLSTIVSTLLILLLVFVAVAILWVVVRNVIQQGTEQISLGKFTLDLKIDQVSINENSNSVSVKVKRNQGQGEFVGLKIIISDGDDSEIFNQNVSMDVYERKTFILNLLELNSSKINKIQIAPIFLLSSGKQAVGDVKDTWEKTTSSGGSGWIPECYNDSNCNEGYECVNDYCVLEGCDSNSSCALTTCIGSVCSDSCGNTFSGQLDSNCPSLYYGASPNGCGFCYCPSGYTASGSECVLATSSATIIDVWASSSDSGIPENTLDNDLTDEGAWGVEGDGEWISYELSQTVSVSYVRFAFYADSIRYFDIQYSTDGSSWTNILTNEESEPNMPNQFQRFDFPNTVNAKYIRFVGHGSDAPSMWSAIVETDINGFESDVEIPEEICTTHDHLGCYGGDVYWYDSCNVHEGSVVDNCNSEETCSSGQCVLIGDLNYDPANYNLVFSQDFEDDRLGVYYPDDWEEDWQEEWYWFKNNDIVYIVQEGDTKAMKFIYPEGAINGEDNGAEFACSNCMDGAEGEIEMYLSWNVMWKPGFDFVISGKVSGGIIGGDDWFYVGPPHYDDGYRVQLSWINAQWCDSGVPYFYIYHYDQVGDSGDSFPFYDPDYPESVYYFDTSEGRWTNFALRIVLNSVNEYGEPGNYDGFVEGYIDGKFSVRKENLRLRNVDSIGFDTLMIYSQFGCVGPECAPTDNEWLLTDDYVVWTYNDEYLAAHPEVPRGRQTSSEGRIIVVPGMKTIA